MNEDADMSENVFYEEMLTKPEMFSIEKIQLCISCIVFLRTNISHEKCSWCSKIGQKGSIGYTSLKKDEIKVEY